MRRQFREEKLRVQALQADVASIQPEREAHEEESAALRANIETLRKERDEAAAKLKRTAQDLIDARLAHNAWADASREKLKAAEPEVAALRAREVALVGALGRFDRAMDDVSSLHEPDREERKALIEAWNGARAALSSSPADCAAAVKLAVEALQKHGSVETTTWIDLKRAALAAAEKSFPGVGR